MAHPYESLSLGPVPSDETCQQVGMPEYDSGKARQECLRFIELLEKLFPLVKGAEYGISRNPHDFGTYYEVVVIYDTTNDAAVEYAFKVERNTPTNWTTRCACFVPGGIQCYKEMYHSGEHEYSVSVPFSERLTPEVLLMIERRNLHTALQQSVEEAR